VGILPRVVHRFGNEWRHANPILLLTGAAAIVVATIGLFLRSSPTLSGVFLVVGAGLLVLSFFVGTRLDSEIALPAEIDLVSLERTARHAESEVARGQVHALETFAETGDTAPLTRAFISKTAAQRIRRTDDATARALTEELQALPLLEQANRMPPIDDVAAGYRSVTLPSGYVALYRRLTPPEVNEATGAYADHDIFFVADLVPLISERA
jgi:hypothetical protein